MPRGRKDINAPVKREAYQLQAEVGDAAHDLGSADEEHAAGRRC
jgi:hypothetical protein